MRTEFIVMQASASMPDSVNAEPPRIGAASTASPTGKSVSIPWTAPETLAMRGPFVGVDRNAQGRRDDRALAKRRTPCTHAASPMSTDADFLLREGEVDPTDHLEGQDVICPVARLK